MNEQELKRISDLLKGSVDPVDPELKRDLWPQMLARLDERSRRRPWFAVLFSAEAMSAAPWYDWALLAVLVVGVCAFPSSIPIWLYHI